MGSLPPQSVLFLYSPSAKYLFLLYFSSAICAQIDRPLDPRLRNESILSRATVSLARAGTETAVPVKKRCWAACSEKDEVPLKVLLADDGSAFQRGEDGSFRLRKPKASFDDRVRYESGVDGFQEFFEASVLQG